MHVLLTVDLDQGATDEERLHFCDKMREQGWTHLKMTNTFRARFEDSAMRFGAIATARGDVRRAAQGAGINYFRAAAEVGSGPPAVWDQAHL